MEDPKYAKGLVKRKVTRVVTPGTILEDNMLDAKSNNYLVAAVVGDPVAGIGVVDVSTGEFLTTEIEGDRRVEKLLDEIMRLEPAEILVPEDADEELVEAIRGSCSATVTPVRPAAKADGRRRTRDSRELLLDHFQTQSLRGFGCEEYHGRPGRLRAGAALPAGDAGQRAAAYPHPQHLLRPRVHGAGRPRAPPPGTDAVAGRRRHGSALCSPSWTRP